MAKQLWHFIYENQEEYSGPRTEPCGTPLRLWKEKPLLTRTQEVFYRTSSSGFIISYKPFHNFEWYSRQENWTIVFRISFWNTLEYRDYLQVAMDPLQTVLWNSTRTVQRITAFFHKNGWTPSKSTTFLKSRFFGNKIFRIWNSLQKMDSYCF